jgi:hypothetical protein
LRLRSEEAGSKGARATEKWVFLHKMREVMQKYPCYTTTELLTIDPCIARSTMADYTRVYCSDDGISHFEELDFDYTESSGAQTPRARGVEAATASPGNVLDAVFRRFALGNSGKHPAPRKQYAIVLTGSLVIQTGDGEERSFGPGQVLLFDDTSGEGHLSTFSSDEHCKALLIPIGD